MFLYAPIAKTGMTFSVKKRKQMNQNKVFLKKTLDAVNGNRISRGRVHMDIADIGWVGYAKKVLHAAYLVILDKLGF